MSFARINKIPRPDDDFWLMNPWVGNIAPYSTLKKTYGDQLSSKIMICITLLCHPDEENNPFYSMNMEMRKLRIKEGFMDVDWEEELIAKCVDNFPFDCLDSIQRAYKEEKDKLVERAKFIADSRYKLDLPEEGQEVDKDLIKIQMDAIKLVEGMQKNSLSIYQQYEKIEEQFIQGKTAATKEGGGKLFRSEKGEL